jgi:hypothetical protein
MAEERVLEHLTLFVGDIEGWIGQQVSKRLDVRDAMSKRVDFLRSELAELDAKREKRMAELADVGLTDIGLEVVARIDEQRASTRIDIADAEAQLSEWEAEPDSDALMAYYAGIVDLVQGRVAQADGAAEVNRALHESLTGVWLAYDAQMLTAEIELRPTGDEDFDAVVAELFGTLTPFPGALELQAPKPAGSPTSIR